MPTGRFTTLLGERAKNVVAVDFMDNFIEENRKANEHLGNVQFVCSDAMSLDFPAGSFDIVFSNWLLMYLNDEEVCAPKQLTRARSSIGG
jgi:phosphoethanolamine N-methyltransferase